MGYPHACSTNSGNRREHWHRGLSAAQIPVAPEFTSPHKETRAQDQATTLGWRWLLNVQGGPQPSPHDRHRSKPFTPAAERRLPDRSFLKPQTAKPPPKRVVPRLGSLVGRRSTASAASAIAAAGASRLSGWRSKTGLQNHLPELEDLCRDGPNGSLRCTSGTREPTHGSPRTR